MSTKAILWIVVLILAALGIWYFMSQSQPVSQTSQTPAAATNSGTMQTQQASVQTQTGLTSGTSDQNLNADLTQIDAQSQSASQGSGAVDQSFNDTAVQQSNL